MFETLKMVLLTKPKIGNYPLGYSLYTPMIPMGLAFLANALLKKGYEYRIVDNYLLSYKNDARKWEKYAFIKELKKVNPSFVGISIMSIEHKEALELINIIRENSNTKIIVGGPHVTLFPDSISRYADYVVVGEGEKALVDIISGNVDHRYKEGNIIKYPPIEKLDDLAWKNSKRIHVIPWEDFDLKEYVLEMPHWGLGNGPIVNLNTSRGCPYRCKFCSILDISPKTFRYFSAQIIFDELKYLHDNLGIKGVCFREDCFTANRKRVFSLCELLIENKLNIEWAAESRVDLLDADLIKTMKDAGCKGILLGVESGSDKMLHKMRKGITVQQTREIFKFCHYHGMKTYASIVFGLPEETEDDRTKTLQLLEEIKPDFTEISIFLGIPGSEYYDELKNSGNYEYFDKETFHLYPIGYKDLMKKYVNSRDVKLPY